MDSDKDFNVEDFISVLDEQSDDDDIIADSVFYPSNNYDCQAPDVFANVYYPDIINVEFDTSNENFPQQNFVVGSNPIQESPTIAFALPVVEQSDNHCNFSGNQRLVGATVVEAYAVAENLFPPNLPQKGHYVDIPSDLSKYDNRYFDNSLKKIDVHQIVMETSSNLINFISEENTRTLYSNVPSIVKPKSARQMATSKRIREKGKFKRNQTKWIPANEYFVTKPSTCQSS